MNHKEVYYSFLRLVLGGLLLPFKAISNKFNHASLVILTYHSISNKIDQSNLSVSIEKFSWQMSYIASRFSVVRIDNLKKLKNEPGKINIAVTFDDGYLDNFTTAFPILQRYKIPACFFITTSFLDQHYSPYLYSNFGVKYPMMTWDHTRKLLKAGHLIGAHTQTHPFLSSIDIDAAKKEIAQSKADIEKETGITVKTFAYPFGGKDSYNKALKEFVMNNFDYSFNCFRGIIKLSNIDFHDLHRVSVHNYWKKLDFIAEIHGCYNFFQQIWR